MQLKKYSHIVEKKDIPEHFHVVWERMGKEVTIDLMENLGGISLYVPTTKIPSIITKIIKEKLDQMAVTKDTVNRIALELNVTDTMVRNIIGDLRRKGEVESKSQVKLFEDEG